MIVLSSFGDGDLRDSVVGCFSSPLLDSVLRPVLLAALPSFAHSGQLSNQRLFSLHFIKARLLVMDVPEPCVGLFNSLKMSPFI